MDIKINLDRNQLEKDRVQKGELLKGDYYVTCGTIPVKVNLKEPLTWCARLEKDRKNRLQLILVIKNSNTTVSDFKYWSEQISLHSFAANVLKKLNNEI